MELISNHRCFNGEQRRYRIESEQLKGSSTVGVFLPPSALATPAKPVPALIWLSGLTCSDENFVQKAGAQRRAAELGLALITPDTSPRGDHVPTDPAGQWDFGFGAGFYVDAEQEPWSRHYRMHSFVLEELPSRLCSALPLDVQTWIIRPFDGRSWCLGSRFASSRPLSIGVGRGSDLPS